MSIARQLLTEEYFPALYQAGKMAWTLLYLNQEPNPSKYPHSLGCVCSPAGGEPDRLSLRGGPHWETSHVIYAHHTPIHPEALWSVHFLQHSLRQTARHMTSQQRKWETDECAFTCVPFYKQGNSITQRWLSERLPQSRCWRLVCSNPRCVTQTAAAEINLHWPIQVFKSMLKTKYIYIFNCYTHNSNYRIYYIRL